MQIYKLFQTGSKAGPHPCRHRMRVGWGGLVRLVYQKLLSGCAACIVRKICWGTGCGSLTGGTERARLAIRPTQFVGSARSAPESEEHLSIHEVGHTLVKTGQGFLLLCTGHLSALHGLCEACFHRRLKLSNQCSAGDVLCFRDGCQRFSGLQVRAERRRSDVEVFRCSLQKTTHISRASESGMEAR